jgi:chemotaxis protein CheX
VGLSAVPVSDRGRVTGLIGVHGEVSGFINVNLSERAAISLVRGLLQEEFDTLTHQVIDGVGEITNIVAGGIKRGLNKTPWGFTHVTVPSVIVGQQYQIAYAKGIEYLSATFEQESMETFVLEDRLVQVAISLVRL